MSNEFKDDLKGQGYDKEEEYFKKQEIEQIERMREKAREKEES